MDVFAYLIGGFCVGFVFGAVFSYLFLKGKFSSVEVIKKEKEFAEQENGRLKEECEKSNQEFNEIKENSGKMLDELNKIREEKTELEKQLAQANGKIETLDDAKKLMDDIKKEMKTEYQNISHETINKQGEINRKNIEENLQKLLNPFKDDIKNCKTALDEVNLKTKTEIKDEIAKMMEGTKQLGKNAEDLASAFRGKNKMQGNWGEGQLKEILDNAGLEGRYEEQFTFTYKNETYRPDIIVKLPDGKRLIIDSKVSVENYIKYYNSTDEKEKQNEMKLHINSIKKHIDELKKYQSSYKEYIKTTGEKLETLDYDVMFIAPENAYVDAVLFSNQEILTYAFENNVAIVTASSLMPVLRMINHLWNIETSNKNIKDIVDKVGVLYNKLSKFCEMTNKTHDKLVEAVQFHEKATNYLAEGNDNVLKTAERIRGLMDKQNLAETKLFIEKPKDEDE